MAVIILTEQADTPATPSTGDWKVYPKSDGFYMLDDAGTETKLSGFADAASDNNYYVRRNAGWTNGRTYFDTLYAALAGNQTIAGVKTFSSDPLIPDEAYGAGWDGSLEPPTKNAVYDKVETLSSASSYPPNYRNGCVLSNNSGDATNDIDITAGNWRDSTNTVDMDGTAMTKRLDADWAVGTNQGFRNSGAAITDTTYHIYLVSKAAGADPDYYAHTSLTVATVITALQAETGGGEYLYARRIGSIIRASGVILPFTQRDKRFTLKTAVRDQNTAAVGTSSANYALASTPAGLSVIADLTIWIYKAATVVSGYARALTDADVAASYPIGNLYSLTAGGTFPANLQIATNTSTQIAVRGDVPSTSMDIMTRGWLDYQL